MKALADVTGSDHSLGEVPAAARRSAWSLPLVIPAGNRPLGCIAARTGPAACASVAGAAHAMLQRTLAAAPAAGG